MNWQQGLRRLSLIGWGFWGVLFCAMFIAGLTPNTSDRDLMLFGGLAGVVGCFFAHKLTCWVLAGFFAPRS